MGPVTFTIKKRTLSKRTISSFSQPDLCGGHDPLPCRTVHYQGNTYESHHPSPLLLVPFVVSSRFDFFFDGGGLHMLGTPTYGPIHIGWGSPQPMTYGPMILSNLFSYYQGRTFELVSNSEFE